VTTVLVDGVKYVPEQDFPAIRLGIGITTLNRQAVLDETLVAVQKFTPRNAAIVVVDDGSENPAVSPNSATAIRNDTSKGIPAAKNQCIEALMEAGVDHLFLLDDDTRPVRENWWLPYVAGCEPHYQYNWTHFKSDNRPVPKMSVLYEDSKLRAFGWSMGCMLYVTRDVINRVGGMHPNFGLGMEEHAEWSQRIHNAGFTSFVHQDVPGSGALFYASDEHGTVSASFSWADRASSLQRNEKLRLDRIDCDDFVEYRQQHDVVVASLFTSQTDPQRGSKLTPTLKHVEPLARSVESRTDYPTSLVVLHDIADEPGYIDAPLCAYRQRWLSEWRWLRDHPDVRYAWLVDATDVVMLNSPFAHMQPDTLYTGWETEPVGCTWLRSRSPKVSDWVENNAQRLLLNCGVVGGDRQTLMRLCQRMNDLWVSHDADPLHEMAFFNIAAYEHPNLVTGPQVTTVFRQEVNSDPHAWFRHK
jgi:hypothetical protein